MFDRLREDIAIVFERDPAARSAFEVLTCYPGLHALVWHRVVVHPLWRWRFRWLARWLAHWGRWLTGIEIHPGATIGRRVFIDHGAVTEDRFNRLVAQLQRDGLDCSDAKAVAEAFDPRQINKMVE